MECGHLERVCGKHGTTGPSFPCLTEAQLRSRFACGECGATESVWLCVTCGALNCGRYIQAHGLMHKEKNKGHSVCMDTSQLSVYCYECDEFVINDTQERFLENLRTLVLTKKLTLEAEQESSAFGRSLRVRRKRVLETKPILPAKKPKTIKSLKKENPVIKSNKKSPRKRIGLKNLGNTCFMNSVLQSLSNIEEFCNALTKLPSLEEHFKRNKDIKKSVERVISDGVIVTEELKKVVVALKKCDEKNASISPDNLLQAIWKVVPRFRGYQQQDAHEFLRYMLDRLHTELLHLLPCVDHKMRMLRSQSNSVVTAVFGGTLQSCVTCLTCHTTSNKDDPFLDLSVDIPPAFAGPGRKQRDSESTQPVCNIHDCLQKFVEREELDDSERFYCKSCKSKQPSTKQFCIRRLPTVLCLHIKRFRWSQCTRTKVDTFIEFPLNGLDMSQYLLRNLSSTRYSNANTCLYDLAAVIVHHGNGTGSGHYTAFATNSQAWFNFNDCSVKETDFQTTQLCDSGSVLIRVRWMGASDICSPWPRLDNYSDPKMNDILETKESNPFHWEDDSRDSQDGSSSILQTSMDDRDDSSNSVQVGDQSPQRLVSRDRERLVLKLRRIHDSYYMVEDIGDSGYLNYSYIRTKFEEYEIPAWSLPSNASSKSTTNTPSKVHRCKTCRKVFNKVAALAAHRKTHTAGFDTSRNRGFSAADFARRFSSAGQSRGDPNALKPSEYEEILSRVSPHPSTYTGYVDMTSSVLPHIVPDTDFTIKEDTFTIQDFVGEGGFARVFSADWISGAPPGSQDVVLKIQMPVNDWEWYCLNMVHSRFDKLSHPLKESGSNWKEGFMSAPRCFTFRDGNILVTEYQRMGTMLDLVNLTKNADKQIVEPIALYLTAELLGLMELIHSVKIVHADIKPDNFLVRHTPATKSESSLQLIDFGKAIDVCLETGDEVDIDTNTDGRVGKYHLDYFGIAGCAYCLLFGQYIEVTTTKNRWTIKGQLRRWWQVKVWNEFFDDFLNPKSEEREHLPSLLKWREKLLNLFDTSEDLRSGLNKAKEIIEMKYLEKWRRSAL